MARAKFGRVGFAALLVLILAVGLALPAGAATGAPGLITCFATPVVHVSASTTTPGQYDWTVNGLGACATAGGTLTVAVNGGGTSTGLGLCAGLVVQDLNLTITTTVTRVFSGEVFTRVFHWASPLSTFPVVTPFLVYDATNTTLMGAGAIFTHIFLKCPPTPVGGSPDSSSIVWVQRF